VAFARPRRHHAAIAVPATVAALVVGALAPGLLVSHSSPSPIAIEIVSSSAIGIYTFPPANSLVAQPQPAWSPARPVSWPVRAPGRSRNARPRSVRSLVRPLPVPSGPCPVRPFGRSGNAPPPGPSAPWSTRPQVRPPQVRSASWSRSATHRSSGPLVFSPARPVLGSHAETTHGKSFVDHAQTHLSRARTKIPPEMPGIRPHNAG
jgi:hypothetical protein